MSFFGTFNSSSEGDFFETFLFHQQPCYQLNQQLLLLFFLIALLETAFMASVVDFLALSRIF